MSLVARHLEEAGIPTVIIGSAKDIVEHCGVPRFVFSDFPLGNPCGVPFDSQMQLAIVRLALTLLEEATGPRSTVAAPFQWRGDGAWRQRYMEVTADNAPQLAAAGEARRRQRQSKGN